MRLPPDFWQALWLTIRLAATTTALLLIIGAPIAQWLARTKGRIPVIIEALLTLPIVLPPTVIGFYLLVIFAPHTLPGGLWARVMGQPLAFSFPGLVAGSVIYSLPFAIQPFRAGLARVSREMVDAARLSGASALMTFWHVTLPLAWSGIAAGTVLSFAHTLGGFGVVLMVGGGIPGKTEVVSIALYDEVRKMDYAAAHACSAVLLVAAFILILVVTLLQRRAAVAE
ncbi:MAG: molybdate ABC transporter permease subunit [Chthoniobacteraceae bacterium]|jgi:molybdate transport system permease protein